MTNMKPLIRLLFVILCLSAQSALAVGLLPIPVLKDVQIRAEARLDTARGWYVYAYAVSNPAQNTGEITDLEIDIQNPYGNRLSTDGLTISRGGNPYDYQQQYDRIKANPYWGRQLPLFVPVGLKVPPRWNGILMVTGVASMYPSAGYDSIKPGMSQAGFELTSYGLPSIRDVWFRPEWVFMVADHDAVTLADREAAGQIEQNIKYQTVTLGPSGVDRGSFAHWNLLRDDLARAIQLGWFPDAALANALTAQLANARAALDARDLYLTHQRLDVLLATISASTPAQRTSEGYGLMYFNVKAIIESTNYNTEEPKVTLSPRAAGYSLGETHTVTATVVDLANGNRPMAGLRTHFYVDSGPHQGLFGTDTRTDDNGVASASYTGTREGIDNLVARIDYCGECSLETTDTVSWVGGPDLTVPFFSPPALITAGGRNFFLSDETENIGSTASPPSVTRYYIFPNQNNDPNAALPIGERAVPALQPGESSAVRNQVFIIPANIPVGTHYLVACADAGKSVAELDEANNCSFNTLERRTSVIHLMEPPSNQPPVCAQAKSSVALLWPPNHKLETVAILNVTDPDNDPVSIKITAITQDEPVNGLGDGDSAPDGFGVGTSQAQLRAERSGTGNGRVYAISFMADDGKGGTCTGQVAVGAPHDLGKGKAPIDDGQNYDSTLTP